MSFSKALRSAISLPHACDHSIHLGLPVGEGTGGDTHYDEVVSGKWFDKIRDKKYSQGDVKR